MCFHLILYLEFSGLFYYSVIKLLLCIAALGCCPLRDAPTNDILSF
jgi:hypothetical protein